MCERGKKTVFDCVRTAALQARRNYPKKNLSMKIYGLSCTMVSMKTLEINGSQHSNKVLDIASPVYSEHTFSPFVPWWLEQFFDR